MGGRTVWIALWVVVGCNSSKDAGSGQPPPAPSAAPAAPSAPAAPAPGEPNKGSPPPASKNPTDATVLVEGANDPVNLIVAGGSLYWVENRDFEHSKVKSVPVTGGPVKVVVDRPALQGQLIADDSALYFLVSGGAAVYHLHKANLDGSNEVTLASTIPFSGGGCPDLAVRDGNVYWTGLVAVRGVVATGVWSVPATPTDPPTAPRIVLPAGSDGTTPDIVGVNGLIANDASGFYFSMLNTFGAQMLYAAPKHAPPLLKLFQDDNSGSMTPMGFTARVIGDDFYFVTANQSTKPRSSALWKSTGAKPAVKVADLPGMEIQYLGGDANGMYVNNTSHRGQPMGIYSVSPTGATALVATTPTIDVLAEPRRLVVDDKRLYFVDGGHSPGPPAQAGNATIYSKPR